MNMIAFVIELMKREFSFFRESITKDEKTRVYKRIEEGIKWNAEN